MKVEFSFEELKEIEEPLELFVKKVESGEARSKTTYAAVKEILRKIRVKRNEVIKGKLMKSE